MQKNKIFKYDLSFENRTFIRMPEDSEIMDIQIQEGKPVMWAMVDTVYRPKITLRFYIIVLI
jgi:hypothetical protein